MDELINIKELIKSMDGYLKRITLALEQTTRVLTAWGTARTELNYSALPRGLKIVDAFRGEKSDATIEELGGASGQIPHEARADSKPSKLQQYTERVLDSDEFSLTADKTKVVESQNFVDVRECIVYSDKAYKLVGYDNKETYIAKQHVVRTESLEGGGTRVIVSEKSAWAISKLEWK
ncbi:hypothetical protein LCGC14_1572910 [marine sediment metagenome]|uniref:Uncharacterized protein n=1 Tax=marine sediment metagenome TaxID=412755 RepID=A0A0F9L093_9ZZZZ